MKRECLKTPLLLDYVGKFVGEEGLARAGVGLIFAATEEDILAGGEGASLDRLVELVGLAVGVDFDLAEVGPKYLRHGGLNVGAEGLAVATGGLNGGGEGV